jgi:purine-binding chemotaxis protein CheW
MSELYLLAHVAGRAVAIESAAVESVVDIGAVTPVPLAAGAVRGLATLRSRVVTVIDTHLALGGDHADGHVRRAIVSQIDGHHYAFLVDSLEDIAAFELQPVAWGRSGRGLIDRDGEPVLVIDLATLVPGTLAA